MLNKLKYKIKKTLNIKFVKIKVLITNPQGESFQSEIKSCKHLPDVMGSDHCPIELVLK